MPQSPVAFDWVLLHLLGSLLSERPIMIYPFILEFDSGPRHPPIRPLGPMLHPKLATVPTAHCPFVRTAAHIERQVLPTYMTGDLAPIQAMHNPSEIRPPLRATFHPMPCNRRVGTPRHSQVLSIDFIGEHAGQGSRNRRYVQSHEPCSPPQPQSELRDSLPTVPPGPSIRQKP